MPFRLTIRASRDLIEIGEFTEQRWGKKQRNHYLEAIDDAMHRIALSPGIGIEREDLASGYYTFPIRRHFIFYRQACTTPGD
jgi:toxin ParE1/3/4